MNIFKKIRKWYDGLPTISEYVARDACENLRKLPVCDRKRIYDMVYEELLKDEPKIARILKEQHEHHII